MIDEYDVGEALAHAPGLLAISGVDHFYNKKKNYDKLSPRPIFSEIRIRTDGNINEEKIKDILGNSYIKSSTRGDLQSYDRIKKESNQMKKMSVLFSLIFILLSLLTMYTSMVRLIGKQQIIIGTMKAVGLNKFMIRLHYASYGFLISFLGCVVGLILGRAVISPSLLNVKKTTITLPQWELVQSGLSYFLIGLIILICMSAVLFVTNKVLRGMPAESMRNSNNMDIIAKKPLIEKSDFLPSSISFFAAIYPGSNLLL